MKESMDNLQQKSFEIKDGLDFLEENSFEINKDYVNADQINEIDNQYDLEFSQDQEYIEGKKNQEEFDAGFVEKIELEKKRIKEKRERKKREREARAEAKRRIADLKFILEDDGNRLVHAPQRTALSEGYSSTFSSKFSDTQRAKKITNKRSRLYQKKKNADMVNRKSEEVVKTNYDLLYNSLPAEYAEYPVFDNEELFDLSAFMDAQNKRSNETILKLYFGTGKEQKKSDINKSMDSMLNCILVEDISALRLDNDKVIADNAERLERLANRVAAFDRMAERHGYFDGLDEAVKNKVSEKLAAMRSIANYYTLRKEIMNDPLYQKRYNEELSMDFTATKKEDEQELAKKLLQAYVVGEDMMAKNGAGDLLKKGRIPSFKDEREGRAFMRHQELYINDMRHDDELLRERYEQTDIESYSSRFFQRNSVFVERAAKTISFVQDYKGRWSEQPGYKDEGYDETKVKGYFEELDKIKVTDIKFSTYANLLDNIEDNYAICEKVDRLWYEIARALDHGYSDNSIDDKKLIEVRAKCNTIQSMKVSMELMAREIMMNPETVAYKDKEWKAILERPDKAKGKYHGALINVAYPGQQEKLMEKWMQDILEEDATKEESIKAAYPYIVAQDKDAVISDKELEKRKASYNRNAIIQDYLFKDTISGDMASLWGTNSTFAREKAKKKYANETKEEMKKRQVHVNSRLLSAMTYGKSTAEVERLVRLYEGSQEEQIQFYNELLEELSSMPLNDFRLKEGGSILDNLHKKERIGRMYGNLNNLAEDVKNLIERNPELNLKLPGKYKTMDDMMKDINVLYSVGCAAVSAHVLAYEQTPSSKLLHGFDVKDLGSLDKAKYDWLMTNEVDSEDFVFCVTMGKILNQMNTINETSPIDKNEILNIYTDIEEVYKKAHAK